MPSNPPLKRKQAEEAGSRGSEKSPKTPKTVVDEVSEVVDMPPLGEQNQPCVTVYVRNPSVQPKATSSTDNVVTLEEHLQDPLYANWVKSGKALEITNDVGREFVLREMKKFHTKILSKVTWVTPCNSCNIETAASCRNGICNVIKREIRKNHRSSNPTYGNTYVGGWLTDPWEIAKCYMPKRDYYMNCSSSDADFSVTINVIMNNLHFSSLVSFNQYNPNDKYYQAKTFRNTLCHPGKLQVTENDMIDNLDVLIDILTEIAMPSSTDAIEMIIKIKENKLTLTMEDVSRIRTEALKALDHSKEVMEKALQDLQDELETGKRTLERICNAPERLLLSNFTKGSVHSLVSLLRAHIQNNKPPDIGLDTWKLENFLQKYELYPGLEFLSEVHKEMLFPKTGNSVDMDDWDPFLICSVLKMKATVELPHLVHIFIDELTKTRDRLLNNPNKFKKDELIKLYDYLDEPLKKEVQRIFENEDLYEIQMYSDVVLQAWQRNDDRLKNHSDKSDSELFNMESIFREPQCFIYNEPETGKMALEQSVLTELSSVNKQLNVISVTGLYRTGKSYMLNKLAEQNSGFPLGSTIEAKTKGIWAWCKDHPVNKNQALLLLDTEGLGDILKGDEDHDNQIFTMATLISSTLIYNIFGAFDQDALNKIRFITEMAKNIKVKDGDSANDDSDFDVYFPEFILAMRDFSLDLQIDGREMSPDEYLEYCLQAQSGTGEKIEKFNEQRLCVRKYFKRRKCFTFDRPVGSGKLLKKLEQLTDEDLSEDFREDTRTFLDYAFSHCQGLKLYNGRPVNGRMFVHLAENYVNKLREGSVPCIMSALQSMAMMENQRALQKALDLYKSKMEAELCFPTEDDRVLWRCHMESKDDAFKLFLEEKMMDDDNKYKNLLDETVKKLFQDYQNKIEAESLNKCKEAIEHLRQVISNKLSDGVYTQPGGYDTYKQDKDDMKRQYDELSGLGVMKEKAYLAYLHKTKAEEEAVMTSDKQLSEQQRQIESEKAERERAEKHEAVAKQMMDMKQQYEAEVAKLHEAHEEDMKKERKHMEELMEKRAEELQRLQKEKLIEVREQQEREMKKLKQEQEVREKNNKDQIENMERKYEEMEEQRKEIEEKQKRLEQSRERQETFGDPLKKIIEGLAEIFSFGLLRF